MMFIQEVCPLFIILSQYWLLTKFVCRQIVFFPLWLWPSFSVPFLVTSTPPPCYLLKYSALLVRGTLPLAASLSMSPGLKISAVAVLLRCLDPIYYLQPFLVWHHHQHYPQPGHHRLQVTMLWAMNTRNQHKVSSLWHMPLVLAP